LGLAGYGKTVGILLFSMVLGLGGVVTIAIGIGQTSIGIGVIGSILSIIGFGLFVYVMGYIKYFKFARKEFYNLLVRVEYGISYFVTFSPESIEVASPEMAASVKGLIPQYISDLYKYFQVFVIHYIYATKGDLVLIAPDSPRAISSPKEVEMLLANWIANTKVAELTGLELTHIKRPVTRELTFFEKLKIRLGREPPSGSKVIEFAQIPVVLNYDSDITPALMKRNLYKLPVLGNSVQEATSTLQTIGNMAVTTMSRPFLQEIKALEDHIGDQNKIIDTVKIPYSFETSKPEVRTPDQKRGDSVKTIVKVLIAGVALALLVFGFISYYPQGISSNPGVLGGGNGQYSLSLITRGQGTTTPSAGTYSFNFNTLANLTASAAQGWQFKYWCIASSITATSCTSTLGQESISIRMSQNIVVIAEFEHSTQTSSTTSTLTTSTITVTGSSTTTSTGR